MTEESFQQGRKLMARANYLRGIITKRKGNVAKWTKIEDSYRKDLKYSQAGGAKKMLDKAMIYLEEIRQKFADLKFPDHNLAPVIYRCKECGAKVKEENEICENCL